MIGAVDVGGTKIVVGVADQDGRLLAQDRFATLPERGPNVVIGEVIAMLNALARGQGEALTAVGVGCVGPLDLPNGAIMNPPNFPGWSYVPLRQPLEKALGVPVRLDNDANAAALAEYRLGAGRGAEIMVYTTISTGIGGGIVVDGRLLHGVGGGAGEFGHQTIRADGPRCGCGNRGCLEVLASGTAIVAAAKRAIADGRGAGILEQAGPAGLHAGHVAHAAAAGDAAAVEIWGQAVEALAIGLGNVVTTLAPDRLVLGGGVAQTGDLLLLPLREALARHVRMVPVDRVDIRIAEHVAEAGIYGAIAVGLQA
ncbi:MAG: glucokinase [Cyanobacteria bacterium RYN_339]|nr:glucokinase [Cyanobacteria bacterium RYN_339]